MDGNFMLKKYHSRGVYSKSTVFLLTSANIAAAIALVGTAPKSVVTPI